MKPIYKRVLIKLSGEALGENGKGFCAETIEKVASEVVDLAVSGLEVALVIGGGNIWRISMAVCTRHCTSPPSGARPTPRRSMASCTARALRTVASMPM